MKPVDYLSKKYPGRGSVKATYSKTEVLQMLEEYDSGQLILHPDEQENEMTDSEIKAHTDNPNILLKIAGESYRCECGCNVFHHPGTDADIYVCNACERSFEAT